MSQKIKCFGAIARPFEAWSIGQQFVTRRRTIFESDLTNYIHLTGYSSENLFGDTTFSHGLKGNQRLVPGLLTASLADGLIVGSGVLESYAVGLVGIDKLKALAPVYANDTIFVEFEVIETKASATKPDRGVVTTVQTVRNQDGNAVLEYSVSRMLLKSQLQAKV